MHPVSDRPAIQPGSRMPLRTAWLLALAVVVIVGFVGYQLGVSWWANSEVHAADAALARRDFKAAAKHFDNALWARPADASLCLQAAETARRREDYEAVKQYLDRYEAAGGTSQLAGNVYRLQRIQQGDVREALDALAACAHDPSAAHTPMILEACIEGILRPPPTTVPGTELRIAPAIVDQALAATQAWQKLCPSPADQTQAHVWRGRLFVLRSDYTSGIAELRQALELDPEHFEARMLLSRTIAQANPEEALMHLRMLQSRHPEKPELRGVLAGVLRNMGEVDEARQLLDEILREMPDDWEALLERGKLALDAQQPAEAESWLRKAEACVPLHPEVHLALGRTLMRLGQREEARKYLDRFQQHEAERERLRKQHDPAAGPG
jgi:tetratricopeptide (TPR) repeat protein